MKKLKVDIGAYRFTPGFGCQSRVEALQSIAMRVVDSTIGRMKNGSGGTSSSQMRRP